ncbi:MAG: dihydrodipicolinate synthase family protein [Armatimonadota bacterium]
MDAEVVQLATHPLWSATPTPLTEDMDIDVEAARRLVDHHLKLGVTGLFLLGTCGEGPWLPRRLHRDFVREVCTYNDGRLTIGVQVTDNSAPRVIENAEMAAEEGADIAVMAAPFKVFRPTPESLRELYLEAIEGSPLPMGIYDRGEHDMIEIPGDVITTALAQKKVVILKDSSGDPARREAALQVREGRPELRIMTGDEFDCVTYLDAGYDGLTLGGGIFNGFIARQIIEAVNEGDIDRANELQEQMNELMWDVYGGREITCWLRGLKHLLVRMGIFSTDNLLLDYDLTPECEERIERALEEKRDLLFPWESGVA